jgi:DNA-binding NtrC family response regulator
VLGPDALRLETVRAATPGLPVLEPGFSLSDWMDRMERRILAEALRRTDGDRNAAGRLLNVERNTLRYKLVKHKLIDR